MYRLDYGNGQVSESFKTKQQAKTAYRHQVEFDGACNQSSTYLSVQRYIGDGEWSACAVDRSEFDVTA